MSRAFGSESRDLALWTVKRRVWKSVRERDAWGQLGRGWGSGLRQEPTLVPDLVATAVIPRLCSAESWSQKAWKK